jgi:RNA polymerase sigma-70 factor (ECF subfamily)
VHDAAGTPTTFAAVFEDNFDTIFGYFARRVPRAEVPDLTAETFRLAHGAWDRFDPTRPSARPWLYGFAANVLRHHQRSRAREGHAHARLATRAHDTGEAERTIDDRLASIDAERRWPEVAAALDALTPIDRDALLLLAWEDLSYAEIAEATDVPIGTVRSRLNRARRQVRELLGADGQQPVDNPSHDNPSAPEEALRHG